MRLAVGSEHVAPQYCPVAPRARQTNDCYPLGAPVKPASALDGGPPVTRISAERRSTARNLSRYSELLSVRPSAYGTWRPAVSRLEGLPGETHVARDSFYGALHAAAVVRPRVYPMVARPSAHAGCVACQLRWL